jgi:hypothetical protein
MHCRRERERRRNGRNNDWTIAGAGAPRRNDTGIGVTGEVWNSVARGFGKCVGKLRSSWCRLFFTFTAVCALLTFAASVTHDAHAATDHHDAPQVTIIMPQTGTRAHVARTTSSPSSATGGIDALVTTTRRTPATTLRAFAGTVTARMITDGYFDPTGTSVTAQGKTATVV